MGGDPEPRPFTAGDGLAIEGEALGNGLPIVLCHGITATRRYVLHDSKFLLRHGWELITYDARAHGESGPAPDGEGYGYPQLVGDLESVIAGHVGEGRFVLGGHSMGTHTAVSYALANQERIAALIVIGPVYSGKISDEALEGWERLAAGLEEDGADGFMLAYEQQDFDPEWRETILRITRERIERHRHPKALAQAIRETPRSRPFESMSELQSLEVPTLVVASHDEADPAHPFKIAAGYAKEIPGARLIVEDDGESPLAWQGGQLSREIDIFCSEGRVAERLR